MICSLSPGASKDYPRVVALHAGDSIHWSDFRKLSGQEVRTRGRCDEDVGMHDLSGFATEHQLQWLPTEGGARRLCAQWSF